MMPNRPAPRLECTPEQVDEAAVWMTLLRASTRDEQTEAGFRRWLGANPAHSAAFEKVSTAFEVTAALPKGRFPHLSRWQRAGYREGFTRAMAAAAALGILLIGGWWVWRTPGIETDVGEQRTLALEDGTQVYLNTDTRLSVDYTQKRRQVELASGEAYFDVAREAARPFVVTAAGRTITALGTSFVVRNDAQRLTVTLIEGRVAVSALPDGASASSGEGPGAIALSAGERVTFDTTRAPEVDRPAVAKVTAWRAGHIEFEKTPLVEAIAEMNRYSATHLTIDASVAAQIPITGIFRAGASRSFARAVADAYGMRIIEQGDRIELAGAPNRFPSERPR